MQKLFEPVCCEVGVRSHRALPDKSDSPAKLQQLRNLACVPFHIRLNLLTPELAVRGGHPEVPAPFEQNHVWAYDFVYDACANGQQFKCLTIVDEYTRECLAIDVVGPIRSARLIEVLSQLVSVHRTPRHMRCDNDPEFVFRAILEWILGAGIQTARIDPGKPWQNGTAESFNGKLRDEWFRSRAEARVLIESWRRHYNAVRPHSSLGYLTSHEFKATLNLSTYQGASFQLSVVRRKQAGQLDDARSKIEAWRRFYNEERPHSALQWQTPSEFARQHRAYARHCYWGWVTFIPDSNTACY